MNYKTLHRTLSGRLIDLIPMADEHVPAIVRLRNSPHVRAFFDEKEPTTEQSQRTFLARYQAWPDDLYWVVCTKKGDVIGTNRLNKIDGKTGVKGSLAIDEAYVRLGPYALEAEILMIDFAFGDLKLEKILTVVRPDNSKMIGLNKELGFELIGPYDLRGLSYNEYILYRDNYKPERLEPLLEHFRQRQIKQL